MADYDWFDRTPTEAEIKGSKWRPLGLHPVYQQGKYTMGGSPLYLDYFQCRRGCGTLVWDPEAHIKNVCTKWEPVVAETT